MSTAEKKSGRWHQVAMAEETCVAWVVIEDSRMAWCRSRRADRARRCVKGADRQIDGNQVPMTGALL